MKRFRYLIFFLVLLYVGLSSCEKRIVPSSVVGVKGKDYDDAAFNFVYVEAIKQKLLGNNGDAIKYFEECIKFNPESDASYYQMAQIVLSGGDLKNGKKFVNKALSIDGKNLWYLMMMAGMHYQEKSLDSAIFYYDKAVKSFPDKENLQLTLGNLYSENKDFEKAKIIFEVLDKKYGVNESSTLSAIKNLVLAKKYDDALQKAFSLIKEFPDEIIYHGLIAEIYREKGEADKAMEVYNQLIDRNPGNPQIQLSLADFLITKKSYDELFKLLNTMVLNSKIERQDKLTLYARLIETQDLIRDYEDKLLLSIMVLEAYYKDDDIIILLRPELLVKKLRFIDASNLLEEIISGNAENYYAWEKLLLVYLQISDYKKLLIKGEECATRFNRSVLAKILYANAALENGKYSIALEELRKAEILGENNEDIIIQILTMRADTYYRMKNYEKAFEVFDEAMKSEKENITLINNYAYYLAEQNFKLKEAEEMARKVIEKEKDNTTFLDTYAWVLYKRGKLNEASRIMERIITGGEKPDAEWYEHYGYILKKQKKCAKAVENWNIAIKLDSTKSNLIKEIENCIK